MGCKLGSKNCCQMLYIYSENRMDWFPSHFLNCSKKQFSPSTFYIQPRNHLNGNKLDWSMPSFCLFRVWKICRQMPCGKGQCHWQWWSMIDDLWTIDIIQDHLGCACMDQEAQYISRLLAQNFRGVWNQFEYSLVGWVPGGVRSEGPPMIGNRRTDYHLT